MTIYEPMKEDLSEFVVTSALRTVSIGSTYQYLESAGSTNDLLKQQVVTGGFDDPPHGKVLLTDYQEHGRGRFDRIWEALPFSSLLFSVLLRPTWPAAQMPWLTMLAGLSAVEAVETLTGLPVSLKWPNDVVIPQNNGWSKVCGILLEGAISTDQKLEYAILGIGLNVNIPEIELPSAFQPATSLMAAAGKRFSRLALLMELLQRIEGYYEAANQGSSPRPQWHERLITIGQRVEVQQMGQIEPLVGVAESTGEWGQLLVRDDGGKLHTIMAADVTLRGKR